MLPGMAPTRRPLPSGTLTLLFTDIEGSTNLVQTLGARRYAGVLVVHHRLMRAAIAAHGGHEVDTQGDAFFAAFDRATAAVGAAIDAQRALAAHPWPADGAIRVRMGLHAGAPVRTDVGYVGIALNQGARVCAVAHGGQIFLSRACRQILAASDHPPDWSFRDLGQHRLKDIRHTEHLFQVLAPGVPDVATPPATAGGRHALGRVLVGESGAARALPESMQALLDAVRHRGDGGSEAVVTLSTADLQAVAAHPATDLTTFRLGRVAEWSLPRYQLDDRFVALALLVDQGEAAAAGRWQARAERYASLDQVLAAVPDRVLVLLGAPGSGKSTLLRRYEMDRAIQGLRGGRDDGGTTFFIALSQYRPPRPGAPLPPPRAWLAERWSARYPRMPSFADLLASDRPTLLLDALNEIPHATDAEYRERVGLWKRFVVETAGDHPDVRILFSCRSLDYSAPLSTPELRVPQITIDPLTDAQVETFLRLYTPAQAAAIWSRLAGSPQLAAVRTPYFLRLLVDQVETTGEVAAGPAGLFTGFVREALRREIERDNPLFQPDTLLTERDCRRIARGASWPTAWALPERGALIPRLEVLAFRMQTRAGVAATSQVRVEYDTALELIDHPRDADIVKAGLDLAVLDEDVGREEITYFHQLLQEYFAARALAEAPDPSRVQAPWRAVDIRPGIRELINTLPMSEELPPLPTTGWEETAVMAAAMAADPEAFVRGLADANLALAGRCANQPEVRGRLGGSFLDGLRWSLVRRSRDPEADLRDRIACGLELGWLGDPRFERRTGPDGEYLMPPLVEIPGGEYPIGEDEPIDIFGKSLSSVTPRHSVPLAAFAVGKLLVTNAEYACFVASRGYEDEQWWDTDAARSWRQGSGTALGTHTPLHYWRRRYLAQPELLDEHRGAGMPDEQFERWHRRLGMTDDEFDAHLWSLYPGGRLAEPAHWHDKDFANPLQPVVGVCWFEAYAYCNWLGAQAGLPFRLPTEAEWEAAARGMEGRFYAYGNHFDSRVSNTLEARLFKTSPVGTFVDGDTPEGVADLTGNVDEWTTSLSGNDPDNTAYPYPYDAHDGREDVAAGADVLRVVRGGSWNKFAGYARCAARIVTLPSERSRDLGFRVVADRPRRTT